MSLRRSFVVAVVAAALVATGVVALAQDKTDKKELELKACGPSDKEVDYKAKTDKTQHPMPDPPADKGLIFVLRPTMMGNGIQTKLAVDGDWKGVNRGNNYFYFTLDPGEHYFCSVAENHSLLTLKVEAGKTYFVQQHVAMGLVKARTSVSQMTDQEGQKKIAGLDLATWTVK